MYYDIEYNSASTKTINEDGRIHLIINDFFKNKNPTLNQNRLNCWSHERLHFNIVANNLHS